MRKDIKLEDEKERVYGSNQADRPAHKQRRNSDLNPVWMNGAVIMRFDIS